MFKQLANLCLETDGRYATSEELQFLKDYLDSTEVRISGYTKIRDHATEILQQLNECQSKRKEAFYFGERNLSQRINNDMIMHLRHSSASMLIGDLDRIREGMLIWFQTIARSFGFQKHSGIIFYLLQDVLKDYLTHEEIILILPILQLEQVVLGS